MPTIAIFYGIVIQMYWRDHSPPHFHAIYQGFEALIAIDSGEVIGGRLPPRALRIVREWLAPKGRTERKLGTRPQASTV
jgi:hypothetical protein